MNNEAAHLGRRNFLAGIAGAAVLHPRLTAAASRRTTMRSLDEIPGRYADIWRIPGRFTKNPDIIRFPSGKLLLVFCDVDGHWAEEVSRITTLESTDGGWTWSNRRVIAEADRRKGEERWVTPRISLLRDGRVLLICDHDDYSHCHEDQPSGIWLWESRDQGRTWSKPLLTGVPGIEPDRIVELSDGTLLMGAHMTFRANRKLAEFVMRSSDGGRTWKQMSIVAQDKVHHHCEGAIVVLKGGELACVMRDNNHNGYPSYVSFSGDNGRTWSKPQALPFAGDRPYAQQLRDGRVLVTYRNQLGSKGTHAWLGDLRKDAGFQPGGTHYGDEAVLRGGALHISGKRGAVTRYTLLPPESCWSDVLFEASFRLEGRPEEAIASAEISRMGWRLDFFADGIRLNGGNSPGGKPSTDRRYPVDFAKPHKVRLEVIANRVVLSVDGKQALNAIVYNEAPLRETFFGRATGSSGAIWWFDAHYRVQNQTEPAYEWRWSADSGTYPDQYQIDRILELRANPPGFPITRPITAIRPGWNARMAASTSSITRIATIRSPPAIFTRSNSLPRTLPGRELGDLFDVLERTTMR